MYKNQTILDQLYFVLVLFFSFIILIVDSVLPIQTLPALAYNLIVLLSAFLFHQRKYLYFTAAIGAAFVIIGLFVSPGESTFTLKNESIRIVSGLFVFGTALVCDKFLKYRNRAENLELETSILEKSNEQLEQFAFVASHDLQEPLRKIINFSEILNKELKPTLNDDHKKYFTFLVEASVRMRQLIQDLLEFSRAGNVDLEYKKTNLNDLVQNALNKLQLSIQENNVQVHVDKLPTVLCSPVFMEQVFQNLISNAIKYKKPNVSPVIHIQSKQHKIFWEIQVTDNGIGIPPESRIKVFEIFKRLHRKEKFKGTGIGLSICKRIIQRHGGKIWVESKKEQGSQFKFTLPK